MGTHSSIHDWDFLNSVSNIKEVFGNRKNFTRWIIRIQEIEQEMYFKLLSLGYYQGYKGKKSYGNK